MRPISSAHTSLITFFWNVTHFLKYIPRFLFSKMSARKNKTDCDLVTRPWYMQLSNPGGRKWYIIIMCSCFSVVADCVSQTSANWASPLRALTSQKINIIYPLKILSSNWTVKIYQLKCLQILDWDLLPCFRLRAFKKKAKWRIKYIVFTILVPLSKKRNQICMIHIQWHGNLKLPGHLVTPIHV
jgi:hypothetical protein